MVRFGTTAMAALLALVLSVGTGAQASGFKSRGCNKPKCGERKECHKERKECHKERKECHKERKECHKERKVCRRK